MINYHPTQIIYYFVLKFLSNSIASKYSELLSRFKIKHPFSTRVVPDIGPDILLAGFPVVVYTIVDIVSISNDNFF